MKRRLIKAIKSESGQALPIVLVLLLLGGLLVAPSLSYASTSLNVGQIVEKNVKGLYAADAGVENALWCLKNSFPSPGPLNINQMAVSIDTELKGAYALYFGELVEVGEPPQIHYDWLAVEGEMVWVEEAQAYKYTITVTWQPYPGTPTIHLYEVGVRLPVGYSYQTDSAASFDFDNNLSTEEPDDPVEQDEAGAYMLNWDLSSSDPSLSIDNQTATQIFYVTGEGSQAGDYTWVGADPNSIGPVGEVTGKLYGITARATRPEGGEITAIVTADAMVYGAGGEITEITILLWQINPE